jgi:mannose-6-phosphate isomerase-like protein (cupin superfamily)
MPMRRRELSRRAMLGRSAAAAAGSGLGMMQPATWAASAQGPAGLDRIRRVVTGHNAKGRSCVLSDQVVPVANMWITSEAEPLGAWGDAERRSVLPTNRPQIDPPPGGTRWTIATMQPARDPKPTLQNRQGFHRTATIDYVYVLSGDVVLLLDEEEVVLKAGDTVIQRNTEHAWRVDGAQPTRLLVALVRV